MRSASVDEGKETAETKLLASAEWSGTGFTMPGPQPQAVADEPEARTTQTLVSAIAVRIEQAFRAEMLALASSPTMVAIDLGGLAGGLQSLTVTMTSTGLDVTFAHSMDSLPEEFAIAAQALAERLSRRFAGRAVRILETTASQAADSDQAESSMQAISGLLGRAAQNR
jgi:hypothetical protein